jgi:hypothetical protein
MITRLRTFKIFGGPPPSDPGSTATPTNHRGLMRLSQLKTNLSSETQSKSDFNGADDVARLN